MPHVEIKCFEGRTEEQKKACADGIAEVIAETLGCSTSSVSVSIKEIPREEWKVKVWDGDIIPAYDHLYKKPGYICD